MQIIPRIPDRLPDNPALIHESRHAYRIWTGRSWFGSVYRSYDNSFRTVGWILQSPGSPCETFERFASARAEAKNRAIRAEGG